MGKPIPFQQVTVEFVVQGSLDGTTPAPAVSFDPSSDDYVEPDDRGIRVVQVEGDLGLIDPDFNEGGAQGDRCVPWVYLDTDGVSGDPDAVFEVADVQEEDGIPVPQLQVISRFKTGGMAIFYAEKGTHIPQGSALAIRGYNAPGPKIVRINVVAPQTALEEAKMKEACCCTNRPCGPFPDDPFLESMSASFFPLEGESEVDVVGIGNYTEFPEDPSVDPAVMEALGNRRYPYDLAWVGLDNDGYIPAEVTDFAIRLEPETFTTATFVPPEGTPAGAYILVAFDPFDPDCNTAGQDLPLIAAFAESPPLCPTISAVTGDGTPSSFPLTPGASGTLSLTGTNLADGDGNPTFTISLPPGAFGAPGRMDLPVDLITVAPDGLSGTVDYSSFADEEGTYDFVLTPLDLSCPPIILDDWIAVIAS